jgi:hypothetical protein
LSKESSPVVRGTDSMCGAEARKANNPGQTDASRKRVSGCTKVPTAI